jgi:hypothetical protein
MQNQLFFQKKVKYKYRQAALVISCEWVLSNYLILNDGLKALFLNVQLHHETSYKKWKGHLFLNTIVLYYTSNIQNRGKNA